jgi:ATP-dependent RNA helicase DeaD
MTTFKQLGLSPELVQALDGLDFVQPSPIQEETIPFILGTENDLIALAQTGTGKTAAFGLPILNKMKTGGKIPEAVILCPTRELCIQISSDLQKYAKHMKGVSVTAIYGGQRMDIQLRSLKKGANIVVGTPGRMHDLIRRKAMDLSAIKQVVLDEADEMLDMGFKTDLDAILEQTPALKQILLFSATISKSVYSIASGYMRDPQEISLGKKNAGAENVTHEYYTVSGRDRFEALKRIVDYLPDVYGIVFCRTKKQTQEVADKLKESGYDIECLHGDISQNARTEIMARFKRKQIKLLIATDVAARGIDVNDLSHIINYNLPDQNETYTHRSGRTGRAQKSGISISILTPKEKTRIRQIENIVGKTMEHKSLPSGGDIVGKRLESFLEEVKNVDADSFGYEKYFEEAVNDLKGLKKEDLIKKFTAIRLGKILGECKNSRNLNNMNSEPEAKRRDDSGKVSIKINIGKKHNLDIKGFFSLVNSGGHKERIDIGRIKLLPAITIFSVDPEKADKVVRGLQGKNFKGTRINAVRK